ncbi:FAD-dependent oxidoreductase [Gordonia shandongensis]|uniref:FAD-dependent oxidoreductase n=1 Tax=Gordonia shandongensis TaxID=376351 RepID=UPI00047E3F21|nr:FAD-dependent oxidoreductase [Gordonia shandongensis]
MRVIVCGAGIAGLTAAVALTRTGHEVRVLEARDDTAAGAAISLWPNALAALDEIGAGDAVRACGGRVDGGLLRLRDGTRLRRPPADALIAALGEPLVVVERALLRDVLTGMLPRGTVRYRTRVTSVTPTASVSAVKSVAAVNAVTADRRRAVVHTDDGAEADADLVIAADGTHSTLARRLDPGLTDRYSGYTAWRAIADLEIDPGLAGEIIGDRRQVGVVPLPGGRTYWFATQRLPEATDVGDDLAHVADLVEHWPRPIGDAVAATTPGTLIRTDLYDRAIARRWSDGALVVIGDAAHPMRPHLGQGGCQAIEDAVVLARALRDVRDPERAAREYERVRRRRVTAVVRESRMIGRFIGARPARAAETAMRASLLVPDGVALRHLAGIAGRGARS